MTLRILTVCLALVATVAAQSVPSPEAQLQAAIHRETVLGDLKGAIAEYRRVIAAAGANRQLAAQAMLRLASAYEKSGSGDDQAIYGQIVNEYADQKQAASIARDRLRSKPKTTTPAERVIWTGDDVPNWADVSPDGEFLAYRKEREEAVVLRKITTGAENVLIKDEITPPRSTAGRQIGGAAIGGSFSADGKYFAYDWRVQKADEVYDELRIVEVQTSGVPVPRVVFVARDTSGYGIRATDWTRDGQRIAVVIGRLADQTRRIGLVDVKTGALTVLKTLEWRGTTQLAVSPDGAYLAFDQPVDEKATQRDVFVLATDGSRQTPVVVNQANDEVVGWSPDGGHLLFKSARGGQPSLWSQPMKDGRPQGAPQILKSAIGQTRILGLSKSGDIFHMTQLTDQTIHTAGFDPVTGQLKRPSAPIATPWLQNWMPSFSRDGKSLFYLSSADGEDVMISFLNVVAGTTRTLPVGLTVLSQDWSPDGRWMVAGAADIEGRLGLYRIDVATGDVAPIVIPPPTIRYVRPQVSADGKAIYYWKRDFPNGKTVALMSRDLTTGAEKQLFEGSGSGAFYGEVSADGRYVGAVRFNDARQITLFVIDLSDLNEKKLLAVEPPHELLANPVVEWTGDSAA
ncbi:MAG: hypothetical protein M3468_07465, partial [Acidobacteriota bacterium]|nr:hypothetical protein [Acidobacteriota bacterium]